MIYSMSSGDPATRQRILHATRALLQERPGAIASMGQVAAAAGVSRQALYLHFADRSALYLAVTGQADREARGPLQQRVDDAPDGRSALQAAAEVQAAVKPQIHSIASALDTLRRSDPSAQKAWEERETARLDRCRAVTRRLADEGLLSADWTVTSAAELMWALTSQRVWEDLVLIRKWSTDRYARHISQTLRQTLVSGPAHQGQEPSNGS